MESASYLPGTRVFVRAVSPELTPAPHVVRPERRGKEQRDRGSEASFEECSRHLLRVRAGVGARVRAGVRARA